MPSFSHSFIQQICMEVKGTVVGAGDIAMKMTIVTTARGIHRLEGIQLHNHLTMQVSEGPGKGSSGMLGW